MKVLYLPVFRASLAYTVTYGRRWSVLEHLLLTELTNSQASVVALAEAAQLPDRLIVEALINLLRAGWVEVRTQDEVAVFTCTELGRKRAGQPKLKAELKRRIRWASLCMDRVTGSWMSVDGLDLVHERDLPPDAQKLPVEVNTLDAQTGEVRDLLELANDEAFERLEPYTRAPARLYARITLSLGEIKGIPADAPMRLRAMLLEHQSPGDFPLQGDRARIDDLPATVLRQDITAESFVVGGPAHLEYLSGVLSRARSHVIVHSCFLHPETLRRLLPDFEAAAARNVRVDLLWGLVVDEEDTEARQPIAASHKVLESLTPKARTRVALSANSSASHLKAVISDSGPGGAWETLIGSCNFLSSWYNLVELSIRLSSPRATASVLGYLVEAQLPASGGWSSLAVRLNELWNQLRQRSRGRPETGEHALTLLTDQDHYACIRRARDSVSADILIGCDLFGLAAETAALVPMERAAELGKAVTLIYRRPSKTLIEQGAPPSVQAIAARGIRLRQSEALHGKFVVWGEQARAISSFNWLATVVGTRSRGAELGVLVEGPGLRQLLVEAMQPVDVGLFGVLAAIPEAREQQLPV